MLKIATWNVNSLNVRLEQTLFFLQNNNIDILCLQELKISDDKFPIQSLENIGYKAIFLGQKTYNGVAIIFKNDFTPHNINYNLPNFSDEQKRFIKADFITNNKEYNILCGYFPNGQSLDSEKFIYKMNWLNALVDYINMNHKNYKNIILLGDYNITLDDIDVYDPIGLLEQIHCSSKERKFFQSLLDLNLIDSQRYVNNNLEKIYTWWDYRQNAFRRNMGLRIDHIWVSKHLCEDIKSCKVIKEMRKLDRPSDHAPLILELA